MSQQRLRVENVLGVRSVAGITRGLSLYNSGSKILGLSVKTCCVKFGTTTDRESELMVEDRELVGRTQRGDLSAFEELVRRYQVYIKQVVARRVPSSAIEDVTQNAFLETFTSLNKFRNESTFKTWMTTIAIRQCYAYHSRRAGRRETPMSSFSDEHIHWLESALGSSDTAKGAESQQAAREVLEFALSKLSVEDRMIVVELMIEDRPTAEVASVLGWSVGRLRVRTHRAKKRLRMTIEELVKGGGRPERSS